MRSCSGSTGPGPRGPGAEQVEGEGRGPGVTGFMPVQSSADRGRCPSPPPSRHPIKNTGFSCCTFSTTDVADALTPSIQESDLNQHLRLPSSQHY